MIEFKEVMKSYETKNEIEEIESGKVDDFGNDSWSFRRMLGQMDSLIIE